MKVSIITPTYNSTRFLRETAQSIMAEREHVDVEWIVVDGGSDDETLDIVRDLSQGTARILCEPDDGAADAINKGLRLATGDVLNWINSDDVIVPGALARVVSHFETYPEDALVIGRCPIVDDQGQEIRKGITRFKEMFYPVSGRFTFQCINYISQPAMYFQRAAMEKSGPLRTDLTAAWDYEFILRLWRAGAGRVLKGDPLAQFRWTPGSISARHFRLQFKEELEAAVADAGWFSLQAWIHRCVRLGIVSAYSLINRPGPESNPAE